MGYILPVNNYQSEQYHRRVITQKKDHYYIDRPFKTILEAQYENLKQMPKQEQRSHPKNKQYRMEEATSLLTGKGLLFHERV